MHVLWAARGVVAMMIQKKSFYVVALALSMFQLLQPEPTKLSDVGKAVVAVSVPVAYMYLRPIVLQSRPVAFLNGAVISSLPGEKNSIVDWFTWQSQPEKK